MKNTEVRKVRGMGRGVFATKSFEFNDVIEECPVILIPQLPNANPTRDYSFGWNKKYVAISLGYGSLYNHSYEPNAYVMQDKKRKVMIVYALGDIAEGEQILINYNGDPENKAPMWFHS